MSQVFDASQIALATGGTVVRDGHAGAVCTDTRMLQPGDWFVALVGERFDGHRFLSAAREAGAAGVVVEREVDSDWKGGIVRVADTLRALQDLARAARARCVGPVVGITGSSGKTTTRALTALALSPLGCVHQTGANLNNHIGVPLTLLGGRADAAASVVEMGTSAPGEIATLADIGSPDIRVITNVGPAHLEELGGLEGVAVEKGALFASARPGDVCCINIDDQRVVGLSLPEGARRVTWGEAAEAQIRLVQSRVLAASLSTACVFDTPSGRIEVEVPAPGHHIAVDAAAALAVALAAGVDLHRAAAALVAYKPVGMRLRAENLAGGALALNDAYNANPDSVAASVSLLAGLDGHRIAVLGDMLELGVDEAEWHARTVAHADTAGLDGLILVGRRMTAAAGVVSRTPCAAFEDPEDAVEALRRRLRPNSRVLFKGSRGTRVERILHKLLPTEDV